MKNRTYQSVWDAIADTPEEAADLNDRARLLYAIVAEIERLQLDPRQVAALCSMTVEEVSILLAGRVSQFNREKLMAIQSLLFR